jgi:hypothetical protein
VSLIFPFIVDRLQYVDWAVNVYLAAMELSLAGELIKTRSDMRRVLVMFCLAGNGAALAVPNVRQRSATAQVSFMFKSYSYGILKD